MGLKATKELCLENIAISLKTSVDDNVLLQFFRHRKKHCSIQIKTKNIHELAYFDAKKAISISALHCQFSLLHGVFSYVSSGLREISIDLESQRHCFDNIIMAHGTTLTKLVLKGEVLSEDVLQHCPNLTWLEVFSLSFSDVHFAHSLRLQTIDLTCGWKLHENTLTIHESRLTILLHPLLLQPERYRVRYLYLKHLSHIPANIIEALCSPHHQLELISVCTTTLYTTSIWDILMRLIAAAKTL